MATVLRPGTTLHFLPPCPGLFHSRSESGWALVAGKALFPQF